MNTGAADPRLQTLPPIAQLFLPYPHEKQTMTNLLSDHRPLAMSDDLPPLQGHDPPRPLHIYGNSNIINRDRQRDTNMLKSLHAPWQLTTFSAFSLPNSTAFSSTSSSCTANPKPEVKIPSSLDGREDKEELGPPNTEIVITDTGETVLKRRRGRPRTSAINNNHHWNGGWRFLTPTVWSVHQLPPTQRPKSTSKEPVSPPSAPLPRLDYVSHCSRHMTTLTDMNAILTLPHKRRGRKSKRLYAGHSCFVWKDIPVTRRAIPLVKKKDREKAL
ncbi:hypothetical protein BX666DRAFT_1926498 [Dichotomocladium elegans]|nr:hypothetical protein BX666DRAFT_1926498 [Dichotomocladium elegans]